MPAVQPRLPRELHGGKKVASRPADAILDRIPLRVQRAGLRLDSGFEGGSVRVRVVENHAVTVPRMRVGGNFYLTRLLFQSISEFMNQQINEIEINGIKYVPKENPDRCDTIAAPKKNMVIVRCESAGCFFGELKTSELDKGVVVLTNARRLWYWNGAASLSQLAVNGTSKPTECKFPVAVTEIALAKVVEILQCSQSAIDSINGVAIWKA